MKEFVVNDTIIEKGMSQKLTKKITMHDIEKMSEASGDYNPIHLDENYAKKTRFKQIIAHGLFCNAMVSNLVGNALPGNGSLLLEANIKYKRPVFVDDVITTEVIVDNIIEKGNLIAIIFLSSNQNGDVVADGSVLTKVDDLKSY